MSLVDDVLAVARGEVGYHETGGAHNDGNQTKYWAEMDRRGNANSWPWCACFVSWVMKHGDATLPTIDIKDGFISVHSGANWFANHGLLTHTPAPGLIVLYSFGQGHTGIVESVPTTSEIIAIEGNTSPDNGGSQDNGGGVYRRRRSATDHVIGYGIPPAYKTTPVPVPTPKPRGFPMALSDDEQRDLAQRVKNIEGRVDAMSHWAHADDVKELTKSRGKASINVAPGGLVRIKKNSTGDVVIHGVWTHADGTDDGPGQATLTVPIVDFTVPPTPDGGSPTIVATYWVDGGEVDIDSWATT